MAGVAAQTFAASPKRAEDLRKFFQDAPVAAAEYLLDFAKTKGLQSQALTTLESITKYDQPDQKQAALQKFATQEADTFSAYELAQTQAARVGTLNFTAEPAAPVPVTLTGKIAVAPAAAGNTDHPTLTTPDGQSYELVSPAIKQEGLTHLYVQHRYLEANCLKAFDGMTVTVRAFATATAGQLAVQQFAPGTPPDFVSGRLALIDGKLLLRVLPDQNVEITNPELVKRLSPFADLGVGNQVGGRLGIILPGSVTTEADGRKTYTELPSDYWMLAKQTPGNPMLELAHGQRHTYQGDVTAPEKWPDQRIFVYGHIDEAGNVVSSRKGALPMPPAIFEDGTPHVADPAVLSKLAQKTASAQASFAG